MFYFRKPCRVSSNLGDFGNFICSLVRATRGLVKIRRKLAYVLQHANQAEFPPWYSIEKLHVEKFCQHYALVFSGLSVLYNVEMYKTLGWIFSLCKWMQNRWVRVELGRCVRGRETGNSLHNESDDLKSCYRSRSCSKNGCIANLIIHGCFCSVSCFCHRGESHLWRYGHPAIKNCKFSARPYRCVYVYAYLYVVVYIHMPLAATWSQPRTPWMSKYHDNYSTNLVPFLLKFSW